MSNTVYATKQTMQQEFIKGKRIPVTNLLVQTHRILGQRTTELDGYKSLIVGIGQSANKAGKSLIGFLNKKSAGIVPQNIKEIKLKSDETFDAETIDLTSLLIPNSLVIVSGRSKGKGFAGVMKRHGFHGGPRTHGQSDRERAPGSIGRGTTPGRVVKGKRMAGHMGDEMVSVRNLTVISFDATTGQLKLKGAVPGNKNGLVSIKVTKLATNS